MKRERGKASNDVRTHEYSTSTNKYQSAAVEFNEISDLKKNVITVPQRNRSRNLC